MAKPPIKWVGGKTQLIPKILPRFPKVFGTYYEPFVGGGAVFFSLFSQAEYPHRAVLNDQNAELINMYECIRDLPDLLTETLANMKREYLEENHEDMYYRVRAFDPKSMMPIDRAARTIFLNKTGFNGLYRVNKSGGFNVPFGKHENPPICDTDNIRTCSQLLRGTTLKQGDFEKAVETACMGDLVYFDPPYIPVSTTANFTSYTSDGFTLEDQKRLASLYRKLVTQGCHVFLSNADVPIIHELYRGFEITIVPARRNVNSKGTGRGPVNEVLVSSSFQTSHVEMTL